MTDRSYAGKVIRSEMTVRQVAADFPVTREIFRRYGEPQPPSGRFGRLEPLEHFARRQGIDLAALLQELAAVTGAQIDHSSRFAQRIHHRFILSALSLTLTLGVGWGVAILWQIGSQGRFIGVPASYVIAHGEAQLWGFISLFIIGISLRTVLQYAARSRWGASACNSLLALALLGIGGGMYWSLAPTQLPILGVLSGLALCLLSVSFCVLQLPVVAARWRYSWSRALLASGLWLVAWAATTLWLRWRAGAAGPVIYTDSQRTLLIELAAFGFAMNSIYGFGQMLLPGLLRIGRVDSRAIEWAIALHNVGTVLACLAASGLGGTASGLGGGLLVAGAVTFAWAHRGFVGRPRSSYREEQGHAPLDLYPPLAFGWLIVSLVLLAGGLLYETFADQALPHAYMGAVRHALTVGFMTTLILGVGQRLMPVLDRTVLALPRLALPILLLIGVGNLLRVVSEFAVLATPVAFRVMPISGVLELLAIIMFTISMIATMYRADALQKSGRVTKRSSLAVLLAEHPWIEDRLQNGGTGYLQRTRSVPQELTIGSFAESEGYDAADLVARINRWLSHCESTPRPMGNVQGQESRRPASVAAR